MSRLSFKRKNAVIMIVYGGVGEFLFQLDLAKRLELQGVPSFLFVKKKYAFFNELAQLSDISQVKLLSLEHSYFYGLYQYIRICFLYSPIVVNSFNSLYFSFTTRTLYRIALILRGRVIVAKKEIEQKCIYETLYYKQGELIWERNERLAEYITGENHNNSFPVLFHITKEESVPPYIHIHPVGSLPEKSYPVKKLIELFDSMKEAKWLFTLTPAEAKWYMTPELSSYLESNEHITLKIKYFSAKELISIMVNAAVFCTVNTGLLWLACMNNVKVVVIDTHTDFEWNPGKYDNVVRLSHDYDLVGESLHLIKKEHEDGTFFESMYLVSPQEVKNALQEN